MYVFGCTIGRDIVTPAFTENNNQNEQQQKNKNTTRMSRKLTTLAKVQ